MRQAGGVGGRAGLLVPRHSVNDQGDDDATLATDTLVIADGKPAADALQVKVRFMTARPDAVPSLRLAAVAVSTAPGGRGAPAPAASAGDPARWGKMLDLPACTQSYPDGGAGSC